MVTKTIFPFVVQTKCNILPLCYCEIYLASFGCSKKLLEKYFSKCDTEIRVSLGRLSNVIVGLLSWSIKTYDVSLSIILYLIQITYFKSLNLSLKMTHFLVIWKLNESVYMHMCMVASGLGTWNILAIGTEVAWVHKNWSSA